MCTEVSGQKFQSRALVQAGKITNILTSQEIRKQTVLERGEKKIKTIRNGELYLVEI